MKQLVRNKPWVAMKNKCLKQEILSFLALKRFLLKLSRLTSRLVSFLLPHSTCLFLSYRLNLTVYFTTLAHLYLSSMTSLHSFQLLRSHGTSPLSPIEHFCFVSGSNTKTFMSSRLTRPEKGSNTLQRLFYPLHHSGYLANAL